MTWFLRAAIGFVLSMTVIWVAANAWAQPPAPAEGTWKGILTRGGEDLAVSMRIAIVDGDLRAWLSARDFRAVDIPLRNVQARDGRLSFDLTGDATTMRFEGELTDGSLAGTIVEDGRPGTFRLTRASASGEPPCEAIPAQFRNGDVILKGALLRPRGIERPPAVLLMHGSGAESRDGGRFLATALCEAGAAALIYDKRGVGGSTGDWRTSSFEDLAGDAVAGLAWLAARADVDPARLGVYGHSQGGSIAPMVANRSPFVAFVIAGAGAGIRADAVERFSVWNAVRPLTRGEADAAEARAYVDRLVAVAASGQDVEAFIAQTQAWRDRPWFEVVAPPPATAGYWVIARTSFSYNAADQWRTVRQPALILYGERDERVPVEASIAGIRAAMKAGGNPALQVVVLPGASHAYDLRTEGGSWPRAAPGYPDVVVRFVMGFKPPAR